MNKRYQGTVLWFTRGYGFLFCKELGRRVFFHIADVNGPDPSINDHVEFELGPSRHPGKPDAAVNVTPVGGV
jgi:cold shock CspA family protein